MSMKSWRQAETAETEGRLNKVEKRKIWNQVDDVH